MHFSSLTEGLALPTDATLAISPREIARNAQNNARFVRCASELKMFVSGEGDYDSLHRAAPLLLLALQLLQLLARPGHVSSSLIRERRGPVHVIGLARDERS